MVQKTYDKPMKGESSKMFARFQIYVSLAPEERTYKETTKRINEEIIRKNSEDGRNRKIVSEKTIEKTGEKWCWKSRAELHDANKLLEQMERDKADFKNITDEIIESYKSIITQCKMIVTDIAENPYKTNGEPYSLASKIKMLYEVSVTLKTAHEQIRLAYGYSTTNNDVNVNANVSGEVEFTKDFFKDKEAYKSDDVKKMLFESDENAS